MQQPHCAYHPDREAHRQCLRCGRMLCDECYDPQLKACAFAACDSSDGPRRQEEGRDVRRPDRPGTQKGGNWTASPGCRVVVAILAIIGGLVLLLLAICGGMIFLNY